ncbi:MAG TPA: selenocysteine-specific translation elongation factor [Ktedonobacterales bacterium]|nr:selenocysteine-specific translation elongation factor [Ktedonobacterales bacterium]
MSCIGTAGHIDHGKSTLVTALTGIDPDRLAEEKARGMTIDLGFAWLTLPSGREASVVDVPGHEGFIKNMLAGVGGIDVALLVIAADEGVMPQTSEHLAILDLLQVRSGVVALTKRDLVDDEWLALVREEVAERLAPTTLANAPIIACSAVTRAGLPELLAALDGALAAADATPGRRDIGRPRLPVDRVFTITGFGAVVTGALQDGVLRLGQEVELLPSGRRARIRGLQIHKQKVEEGRPGGRLAVNLAGIATNEIARGEVVTLPGRLRATSVLDVRLEVVASAPRPVAHNALLDVYIGAAETPARVALLDADELRPGASGWAQLRLRDPLVAVRGDRFIVRVASPSLTVGGGLVVETQARRHKRHDAATLARLAILAQGDPADVTLAALSSAHPTSAAKNAKPTKQPQRASGAQGGASPYGGRDAGELAQATGLPAEEIADALTDLAAREQITRTGALYYATAEWARLRSESQRLLGAYHAQYPLRSGMPREEWRARLGLSPRETPDVITALAQAGDLTEFAGGTSDALAELTGDGDGVAAGASASTRASGGARGAFVRLPAHEVRLTAEQERAANAMLARFRAAPFTPPTRDEVEDTLSGELTAALIERGALVKLSAAILLDHAAYVEATRRILAHLRAHDRITVAEARDLLGATRKYTLALFESLDERHITLRQGDDRIAGRSAKMG